MYVLEAQRTKFMHRGSGGVPQPRLLRRQHPLPRPLTRGPPLPPRSWGADAGLVLAGRCRQHPAPVTMGTAIFVAE